MNPAIWERDRASGKASAGAGTLRIHSPDVGISKVGRSRQFDGAEGDVMAQIIRDMADPARSWYKVSYFQELG